MVTGAEEIRRQVDKYGNAQNLMRYVDFQNLYWVHVGQPANKAAGIDGVRKKDYGKDLEANLEDLVERLRRMAYIPKPSRRKFIKKANGKMRPLGIPSYEDRLVQGVMAEMLGLVYEPKFLECSFGFRPHRGAHDAVRAINSTVMSDNIGYVFEADIRGFFDNMDHRRIIELLSRDIKDRRFLRYIERFLKAGVMEDAKFLVSERGSAQGGLISPVIANVYLHYALDLWFETEVRPNLRGFSRMVRYADDFLIMFEYEDDALKTSEMTAERLGEYSLELAGEKTRILPFGKDSGSDDHFDFLGFTFYGTRTRKTKRYRVGVRTSEKKLRQKRLEIKSWLNSQKSKPVKKTMMTLNRKLQGHCAYYSVNGNIRKVQQFYEYVKRRLIWMLRHRSQRHQMPWEKLQKIWDFYIEAPRIRVNIWYVRRVKY